MAQDYFGDQDQQQTSGTKKHRRHSDHGERLEEEVRQFASDPTKLAREIISLRKELNRLHFKVKTYQQKSFNLMLITSILSVLLLLAIAYGVFFRG